jgi:guanosine-3',5'-bis(diphosphate) 3'-pyrophosphohydrolase
MADARQTIPAKVPSVTPSAAGESPAEAGIATPLPSQDPLEQKFEELIKKIHANRPSEDISQIRKVWNFCVKHHAGQMRASGEPYIIHPLAVAGVLAEMKMDATGIAAGLLHDAVEDTPATTEEIQATFGDQVAHIVEGVTKIDKIEFANREDRQAENVR